jgi:glycosyltransferase involved in cell wall biosynthesis
MTDCNMTNVPDRGTEPAAARPQSLTSRTKVSLVIPVFNSETSLRTLHHAIAAYAASSEFDFEIVYVDDASADGSLRILHEIRKAAANVVVVEHPRNRGQPRAVLTGIFAASSDIVVTLDDDLQHDPGDIPRLLATLEGAGPRTLVMGISDARRRPRWRTWCSISANAVSNLFLAKSLPLRLTTFCALRRQLCAQLDPGSDRELALMTALVQAADRTLTVPMEFRASIVQDSRYDPAALYRLFMSRSDYYRLSRILAWLAGVSLLMMANDVLLLTQEALRYPVLNVLVLVSGTATWLMLVLLAIKVARNARAPELRQARV